MCSISLYMDNFDGLCLKEPRKRNGRPQNQMVGRGGFETLLDLDYAIGLSILDENVSKMNELWRF